MIKISKATAYSIMYFIGDNDENVAHRSEILW